MDWLQMVTDAAPSALSPVLSASCVCENDIKGLWMTITMTSYIKHVVTS